MTTSLVLNAERAGSHNTVPRRTSTEHIVLMLLGPGMMASFVALVCLQLAVKVEPKPGDLFGDAVKSQLYYIAHAIEIGFLFSAGLISLFSTDFRTIDRGYRLRFFLLIGAALLMTVRGYALSDLLSTKLVAADGPFPFVVSLLVLIGARRSNWDFIDKLITLLALILSGTVIVLLGGLQAFNRIAGIVSLEFSLDNLYWPASWVALKHYPCRSVAGRLRFLPILIYGLGSLFTQTRLNFVMIFTLMVVYAYVQHRRRRPQTAGWTVGLALIIWLSLFTAVFLRESRGFEKLEGAAIAFSSRLEEDTRTGQLQAFAENVPPGDLFLGRGSFARWNWDGLPWGGADLGYLTLLFYGGVPLLLSYFAAHIAPCLKAFGKSMDTFQLAAAGVVFLYGVRMFSSEYPNQQLGYYSFLFCVGMCISRPSAIINRGA